MPEIEDTDAHDLTPTLIRAQLLANGRESAANPNKTHDFEPVVKWFTPDGSATWLITELDPEEPDYAFGLCDLGMGCPELGTVPLSELKAVRGKLGLKVERDLFFTGKHPLSHYVKAAMHAGHIISDPE